MTSRMYKKFNEQMVKENLTEAVSNPAYFAIWELGRKFERTKMKGEKPT